MKIFKEYIIAITVFSLLCSLTACWGGAKNVSTDDETITEIADTSTEELTETDVSTDAENDTGNTGKSEVDVEVGKYNTNNCHIRKKSNTWKETGQSVEQNHKEAFKWNLKAAENGDSSGMFNVSRKYEFGLGVERDPEKATYWLEKSGIEL